MKKVNVIIPAYNCGKYIGECLNSLILQDYKDIVITVINDASKDDTKDVVLSYQKKDDRIVFIDNAVNGGAAKARNDGLKNNDCDYFCFVDGDDRVEKDYVSTMLNLFDEETLMTSCAYKYERRNTKPFPRRRTRVYEFGKDEAFSELMTDKTSFLITCNKMFKTEYSNGLLFDEKFYAGEDVMFCNAYLRNCPEGKVKHTTKKLYHYNKTKGSLSSMSCTDEKYKKQIYMIEGLESLKKDEVGKGNAKYRSRVNAWIFLLCLQFIYHAHGLKKKDEVKRLKVLAKEYLSDYKRNRKYYSSFRKLGVLLFALERIFL